MGEGKDGNRWFKKIDGLEGGRLGKNKRCEGGAWRRDR